MATADLTVIGLGRADPSASEYIADKEQTLEDKVRSVEELLEEGPPGSS